MNVFSLYKVWDILKILCILCILWFGGISLNKRGREKEL